VHEDQLEYIDYLGRRVPERGLHGSTHRGGLLGRGLDNDRRSHVRF